MNYMREIRKAHKKSQQDVADYLGITRQAYSNYETSTREADYETLLKIGEFFDVSVDYLLRGDIYGGQIEKAPAVDAEGPVDIDKKIEELLSVLSDKDSVMLSDKITSLEAAEYLSNSIKASYEFAQKIRDEKAKNNE